MTDGLALLLTGGTLPSVSVPVPQELILEVEFGVRERSIVRSMATDCTRSQNFRLDDWFNMFSFRFGASHWGRISKTMADYAKANDETYAALDNLGITGEKGYIQQNPEMTVRDYLCLVPEEMLPDDYIY